MMSAMLQDEILTTGVLSRRFLAWCIDLLCIFALACLAWVLLLALGLVTLGLGLPLMALLPLIPFCYHLLFLASPMAATPGQAMMGLVVVRNDDFGRPTPPQAAVSTLVLYVTLALGAIWMLVALVTLRKRTFHDMLSGLVVVRRRALMPPDPGWGIAGGYPLA